MSRVAGNAAGLLTLLLDAAKGYLAVALAAALSGHNIRWMAIAAVLAAIGHIFTPWLGFHGGKGVATGLGSLFPIGPLAMAAALLIWLIVVIFWHYASLGSVVASAVTPLLMYLLYQPGYAPPWSVTLATTFICTCIVIRHKENLQRIIRGEEEKFAPRG